MNKITKSLLVKHIKKCKTKGIRFNFLGLVENKELTSEVESLFFLQGAGICGYDWINGNDKLKALINA